MAQVIASWGTGQLLVVCFGQRMVKPACGRERHLREQGGQWLRPVTKADQGGQRLGKELRLGVGRG